MKYGSNAKELVKSGPQVLGCWYCGGPTATIISDVDESTDSRLGRRQNEKVNFLISEPRS